MPKLLDEVAAAEAGQSCVPFESDFVVHENGCPEISVRRCGKLHVFEGHVVKQGQVLGIAFSMAEAWALAKYATAGYSICVAP